jgi:hypothetical protein
MNHPIIRGRRAHSISTEAEATLDEIQNLLAVGQKNALN